MERMQGSSLEVRPKVGDGMKGKAAVFNASLLHRRSDTPYSAFDKCGYIYL
jgi:hypothetical protein